MITVVMVAMIGALGSGVSVGCLNIGSAFLKLFMIIEVIGKFLYLPIWYKGALLDTLYSINVLGELVELNPDTFISQDDE
jgi:hypothetical protein